MNEHVCVCVYACVCIVTKQQNYMACLLHIYYKILNDASEKEKKKEFELMYMFVLTLKQRQQQQKMKAYKTNKIKQTI